MKAAKIKKGSAGIETAPATVSTPDAWPWLTPLLILAGVILGLEAYWPAASGPFVFDDEYLPFRDTSSIPLLQRTFSSPARLFMNLSFWANQQLFGPDPFSFHLTNILIHLFNSGLVFLALRKLLQMTQTPAIRVAILASFGAAIFLLHPVQTESVAYIAGRSESLSFLFFASAYLLFLYKRRRGIGWSASCGVIALFGAAFLTKEHTAVLPLILVLTDILFSDVKPIAALRRNWRLYVPMAILGFAGVALVSRILLSADTAGFRMKDLPWHDYFYTEWRAIWVYLRLFIAPVGLNADYDFPITRSPFDPAALAGLIGLLAIIAVAFYYRRRFPLAFYGVLVFFILLAPTSSIVPIKDALAERRLYLPIIGLLLVLCDLLRNVRISPLRQAVSFGAIILILTGLTHARSAVWGNSTRLWQDTIEKSPRNARAHFHLGMEYFTAGQFPDAIRKFEDVARLGKKDYSLLIDWGLAYDALNDQEKALAKFREAAVLQNTGHVRGLIGMSLAKQKKTGAALDELNEAVKLDAAYDNSFVYRGNVYMMLNEYEKAEADYRRALAINPDNEAASRQLAALARQRGSTR